MDLLIFSSEAFSFTQLMPPSISLAASSIPQITISFTPFALAPGVLKTTMPFSAHFSSGILLTPAPALATATSLSENSISCIDALRTRIASASFTSSVFVYPSPNTSSPTWATGFKHVY